MARSKSSTASPADGMTPDPSAAAALAAELSYSEAQTALELILAQLQSSDLAVEDMAALYERARAYAQRCEQVLQQVEQTIELWDPQTPESLPQIYSAAQIETKPAVSTTPDTTAAEMSATDTCATATRSTATRSTMPPSQATRTQATASTEPCSTED